MASWLDLVFGDTPQVAPYRGTHFQDILPQTLGLNIENWGDITQLGNLWQQYMMGGLEQAGFPLKSLTQAGVGLIGQEQAQAKQFLAGQIPQDVLQQVYRSGAYQGLGSGTAGSPMNRALQARDLGITSLGLISQGAGLEQQAGNAAQRWAGLASGTVMNPSTMMVSPQQQAALEMQNRLYRQATKQLRYNIAAQPDPRAAGISGTIMNLLGAYLGHGMGGGSNITPNYGDIMGASNATGGGGPGMGLGGGFTPQPAAASMNPGFGANFMSGYRGQDTQGLGGTMGSWWGKLFNQPGGY